METDRTEMAPIPEDLPQLDAETLAAVRQLQGGEVDDSTRHLFETFEPQLCAYFRRNSCQDHEADDLTQTVFIRMLERIGTLKDPARFHFWLFKIARNHLLNYVRDSDRERERHERFAAKARRDSEEGTFWARGVFEPGPEARLTVRQAVGRRRVVLPKLLKTTRLAPQTRRSLLLRLGGAGNQEIARELEVSAGTVRSQLSRASAALSRNLEQIDLDAVALDDADAALVAALTPELLTFKREALEADPAYPRAGILETASAHFEGTQESDVEAPDLLDKAEEQEEETEKEESAKDEAGKVERGADSPAEIAAVVRQDRRRGRPRRRAIRSIPPAGQRDGKPALERLSRDDLGYPLILLEEAAAHCGDGHAFDPLALKAKLTCAGALLERGRRFAVARRAAEIVRLAILLIGHGGCDDVRRKAAEGRSLLESYLARTQGGWIGGTDIRAPRS